MSGAASTIAGIAGVGGVYTGNKAASAQREASNSAYNNLEKSKNDAVSRLDPYANYGEQALVPLSSLLYGKNYDPTTNQFTGDVSQQDRMNSFQQSPGYQYQLDQGLKAVERRNAATGTLLGGNTLRELQETGQGLANQDYYNFINTLVGQANIGLNAATNQGSIISNIGSQMAGYQYAGGMANAQKYANLSNALFNIAGMGTSSALQGGQSPMGGMGSMASSGGTYNPSFMSNAGMSSMASSTSLSAAAPAAAASDINLKENIEKVGEENGFNIYEFNYKGKPERYRGVMAQEVINVIPDAVLEKDGYLAVDYNKIGIEFKRV